MAVTEPLPFVPAMWIESKPVSGCPSASHRREIFSSPSFMPKVSSANRRSSTSACGVRGGGSGCGEGGVLGSDRGLRSHEAERASDRGLHLAAVHHQVQHPVVDEELASLKALGQLLAN